jgi:hypothetical protein
MKSLETTAGALSLAGSTAVSGVDTAANDGRRKNLEPRSKGQRAHSRLALS